MTTKTSTTLREGIRKSSSLWLAAGLTVVVLLAPSLASAKVLDTKSSDSPVTASGSTGPDGTGASLMRMRLADNVVVTPGNQAAPAAAQPAAQQVVVPQSNAAPAQAAPVVEDTRHTNVHAEVREPHNFMSTIAVSAIMGGVAGALVGGAIYYLGDRDHAVNIGYWAAGGVLLGTGIGITQVMVQESRVSNATASRFSSDPARTYRLALYRVHF